jgi:uncharacterized RDD family membrane protein YckC
MDIERHKNLDPMLGEAEQDLMTLVDLQRFLADELSESVDFSTDFSKSFTPLSEGLGIHQFKNRSAETLSRFPAELPRVFQQPEFAMPPPPPPMSAVEELLQDSRPTRAASPAVERSAPPKVVARFVDESAIEEQFNSRSEAPVASFRTQDSRLKQALNGSQDFKRSLPELESEAEFATPPPLPKVGLLRRSMAALMDQVFVGTLAVLTLIFVTNVLSSGSAPVSGKLLKEFTQPQFAKYLLAGFATLWFGYLSLSVGVLESTFGMWIWGMRINYGREQRFIKKVARVGLSFLFLMPLLPGLILVFQRHGRNLIDSLSGTDVYRTA